MEPFLFIVLQRKCCVLLSLGDISHVSCVILSPCHDMCVEFRFAIFVLFPFQRKRLRQIYCAYYIVLKVIIYALTERTLVSLTAV